MYKLLLLIILTLTSCAPIVPRGTQYVIYEYYYPNGYHYLPVIKNERYKFIKIPLGRNLKKLNYGRNK